MPEVDITPALRDVIKTHRKEIKLRGDDLSRKLKKNTSYISQLETGKLKTIDISVLNQIFEELFQNDTVENRNKKISEIYKNLELTLSDKELKRQEWLTVMDLQYRLIPIPDSLIDYIQTEIKDLNTTPQMLVTEINKNTPLKEVFSEDEISNMEDNHVNQVFTKHSSHMFIKFNLPANYINDILEKKTKRCNFITMQAIIFNILKLKGINNDEAYDTAKQILLDNKFYSLLQKQKLPKNSDKLASYDVEFQKHIDELTDILSIINDRQPGFLNPRLEAFINNIKKEPEISFALIKRDLSGLHKLNVDTKKAFMEDFEALISHYSELKNQEPKKIETL